MEPASASPPSGPAEAAGVRCRDVIASYRRGFRRKPALRGVTFRAAPGRVTAVVGANGAGKTSLFRVLLGFLDPDAGEVRVGGEAPRRFRRRWGVPYLPESEGLPRGWTVDGFLRAGLRLAAPGGADRAGRLSAARSRAGLGGRGGAPLTTLSRGGARRLVLSYVLLGRARVVLLDEPLAGLDPPARRALETRIAALRDGRATVLLASHDLDAVARLADRIVVLVDGTVARTLESGPRTVDTVRALRAAFAGPGAGAGR